MKRLYKIAFCIIATVLTVACGEDIRSKSETWGFTECYEDFLWSKYEPEMMERKIEIELNPDACKMFEKYGAMTFYISESKDRFEAPQGVDLYFDGEKCEDYHFDIDLSNVKDDGTTQHIQLNIGIQFTDVADVEKYTLYFGSELENMKYASTVYIDEIPYSVEPEDLSIDFVSIASEGIVLEKEVVMNPLKKGLIWTMIILTSILIISIIFSRLLTPTVKVSRITITGAYHRQLSVRGYSMVVLSASRSKQSFLNKLYKGKILYEVHPTWHSDVTISPRNNKSVTMRYDASHYSCSARILNKGNNYVLNDLKERTNIDIRVI